MADETTVATGPGPGGDAVSVRMIVLLAIYLAALTALLLWNIYRKWPACGVACADQVATSATPSPSPTPTPTASPTPAATPTITPAPSPTAPPETTTTPPTTTPSPSVVIESVSPKTVLINCTIQVTIKGSGFKPGATAIFDGVAETGSVDPTGQFITVRPPSHAEGDADLVVRNTDGTTSDIAKAAFTYTCPATPENDLFWLVISAGALGGALHGLRSLYWYVGLRSLLKSWTLMYLLLPFTGATIALVFYVVVRAGLLPVQTSKNASLGMIAVALLVGLFSQQAAVKLKDIADAFLAKPASGPPRESRPQGSVPPGDGPRTNPDAPKPAITPGSGQAGTSSA